MNLVGDFHIHSNFCPHGTSDKMDAYVENAIERGLKHLTFTEHAPLPQAFFDPTPDQDSSMKRDDVDAYLKEINRLKQKYKDIISIYAGFEVDYITGFEEETRAFLDKWGTFIDDAILSVHMLKAPNGEYVCLDYSEKEFARIVNLFGSIDAVYTSYYRTVLEACHANLGIYKPKRIGHLTLVEKFSLLHPSSGSFDSMINTLLDEIKNNDMELDVNTAGYYKEFCQTSYPNPKVLKLAIEKQIPLVFGSDSHTAAHVGRGIEFLPKDFSQNLPKKINV